MWRATGSSVTARRSVRPRHDLHGDRPVVCDVVHVRCCGPGRGRQRVGDGDEERVDTGVLDTSAAVDADRLDVQCGTGQTSVALSWYGVDRRLRRDGIPPLSGTARRWDASSVGYVFGGLTCGTNYTFGVAAVDAAGNVSATATMSVTTAACADTTAPSTPTGLSTSGTGQTSVDVVLDRLDRQRRCDRVSPFRNGSQVGTSSTVGYIFGGLDVCDRLYVGCGGG